MAREHENTRTCGGLGMLHHARKGVSVSLASRTNAETMVVVEGIHDAIDFDTLVGHQKGLLYPHMRGHAPSAGVSGVFCCFDRLGEDAARFPGLKGMWVGVAVRPYRVFFSGSHSVFPGCVIGVYFLDGASPCWALEDLASKPFKLGEAPLSHLRECLINHINRRDGYNVMVLFFYRPSLR